MNFYSYNSYKKDKTTAKLIQKSAGVFYQFRALTSVNRLAKVYIFLNYAFAIYHPVPLSKN